jgi:C_GCAxxG_C_C family probable redox protein
MESKENKAIASFKTGLNCAQAVLTAYSDDLNFDNDLALSISCGFGGGMGRLQETCGAVTGSFMVLGIFNSKRLTDNKDKKEETYSMIQEFSNKFRSIHGSMDCKSLLKCDLKTNEGKQYIEENKLTEKVCEKCISDSIKIIEELLGK